jgi:putative endonuclease
MREYGGWVYIMADRYRGTHSSAPHRDRVGFLQALCAGSVGLGWPMPSITDAITHEKRVKRWRREWKFALIEEANSEWQDLSGHMV